MENLRKLRLEKGLSQQALAEKFNLTQQSIYKYENGLAEPDIETLKSFAAFFGISVDYLIGASVTSSIEDAVKTFRPTEREIRLLQNFRYLTPELQNSVEAIINNLNKEH
ncbi:MAG: helix-turn-helix domain-containing protein [bacterium]|nr:helix-turn-helix domain-containing protein [bacterium]